MTPEGVNSLAQVQVRQNESLDQALRRFKKQLQQSGILKEAREHEHYEKPSDKRRKAEAASRRKRLKSLGDCYAPLNALVSFTEPRSSRRCREQRVS